MFIYYFKITFTIDGFASVVWPWPCTFKRISFGKKKQKSIVHIFMCRGTPRMAYLRTYEARLMR